MITVCLLLPDISSQPEVEVCAVYPGLWDSSLRSPSRFIGFCDQLFLEIQDYFLITDVYTNGLSQVGKGTQLPGASKVLHAELYNLNDLLNYLFVRTSYSSQLLYQIGTIGETWAVGHSGNYLQCCSTLIAQITRFCFNGGWTPWCCFGNLFF